MWKGSCLAGPLQGGSFTGVYGEKHGRVPGAGRALGSCTDSQYQMLAFPPSHPVGHPRVPRAAFGVANEGGWYKHTARGEARTSKCFLKSCCHGKKGIQGHSHFLGSTECWEMFPACSWEIRVDSCSEQEGCSAAGAGGVFYVHLCLNLLLWVCMGTAVWGVEEDGS